MSVIAQVKPEGEGTEQVLDIIEPALALHRVFNVAIPVSGRFKIGGIMRDVERRQAVVG